MKCPNCKTEINVGALMGAVRSRAKTAAARKNAKKGGWPKGRKRWEFEARYWQLGVKKKERFDSREEAEVFLGGGENLGECVAIGVWRVKRKTI